MSKSMRLIRDVRFSILPFQTEQVEGFNPYASKPAAPGLGLFFEMGVEITGPVDPDTGFVVNVCEIDIAVRESIVPLFVDRISNRFARQKSLTLAHLYELIRLSYQRLNSHFNAGSLGLLTLKLNPYAKLALSTSGEAMVYYSEKFEFAAMHKLWNDSYDEAQNQALFGKCANPNGHGHNYLVEVTIKATDSTCIDPISYEKAVDSQLINFLDHKNLNKDVDYFKQHNPTMENIAIFAWDQLIEPIGADRLHCITVWESDRTQCSYFGP